MHMCIVVLHQISFLPSPGCCRDSCAALHVDATRLLTRVLTSTWLYTSSRHQKSFSFTRWVRLAYAKKRVCGSRKPGKLQCDE